MAGAFIFKRSTSLQSKKICPEYFSKQLIYSVTVLTESGICVVHLKMTDNTIFPAYLTRLVKWVYDLDVYVQNISARYIKHQRK